MSHLPLIDQASCVGCWACNVMCPLHKCITIQKIKTKNEAGEETTVNKAVLSGPQHCISCGHCFAMCPRGCISMYGKTAADCQIDRKQMFLLENAIRYRRSIRKFKEQELSKDALNSLCQVIRYAPSARNKRPITCKVLCKTTVLSVQQDMCRILEPKFPGLTVVSEKIDVIFRGAPNIILFLGDHDSELEDAVIALTQLELQAVSLGFGTFYAGFLVQSSLEEPAVKELLKIGNKKLLAALAVGTPFVPFLRSVPRQDVDLIFID